MLHASAAPLKNTFQEIITTCAAYSIKQSYAIHGDGLNKLLCKGQHAQLFSH